MDHLNPAMRYGKTESVVNRVDSSGAWWRTPLIPALGRQKQEDLCELKASLVYRVSSRTVRTTQRNSVSKNQNKVKTTAKRKQVSTEYNFSLTQRIHIHFSHRLNTLLIIPTPPHRHPHTFTDTTHSSINL